MKDVIAFDEMTYQYDEDYKLFLEGIKYSFNNAVKMGHNHLFTTDANGLYDTFLDCLPAEFRQILQLQCLPSLRQQVWRPCCD